MSLATLALRPTEGPATAGADAGPVAAEDGVAGFCCAGVFTRKESRSSVSRETLVTIDSGTPNVTVTPPLPLRSSSSKTASLTCTLPPVEDMRPRRLSLCSLDGGTDETSTASHASVSRSLGPTRLNWPVTPGRAASPVRVDCACRTMSPGKVAASFGTATAPPLASSSSATFRTGCLL